MLQRMRRFAWQIGGVATGLAVVVTLGLLAFGCGSGSARPTALPRESATIRTTASANPQAALVEAAARHYVDALNNAMKTGSPAELDTLSVPGSQAEGNAGVSAHIVRDTGKTFVVTSMDVSHINSDVSSAAAIVTIDYVLTGYDAKWPSLQALGTSRQLSHHQVLELDLLDGRWLIASAT